MEGSNQLKTLKQVEIAILGGLLKQTKASCLADDTDADPYFPLLPFSATLHYSSLGHVFLRNEEVADEGESENNHTQLAALTAFATSSAIAVLDSATSLSPSGQNNSRGPTNIPFPQRTTAKSIPACASKHRAAPAKTAPGSLNTISDVGVLETSRSSGPSKSNDANALESIATPGSEPPKANDLRVRKSSTGLAPLTAGDESAATRSIVLPTIRENSDSDEFVISIVPAKKLAAPARSPGPMTPTRKPGPAPMPKQPSTTTRITGTNIQPVAAELSGKNTSTAHEAQPGLRSDRYDIDVVRGISITSQV
ncbi:hypothetical protein V8F06_014451 [Rhypophila decipiens]